MYDVTSFVANYVVCWPEEEGTARKKKKLPRRRIKALKIQRHFVYYMKPSGQHRVFSYLRGAVLSVLEDFFQCVCVCVCADGWVRARVCVSCIKRLVYRERLLPGETHFITTSGNLSLTVHRYAALQ